MVSRTYAWTSINTTVVHLRFYDDISNKKLSNENISDENISKNQLTKIYRAKIYQKYIKIYQKRT
jgi:hypothetical protein